MAWGRSKNTYFLDKRGEGRDLKKGGLGVVSWIRGIDLFCRGDRSGRGAGRQTRHRLFGKEKGGSSFGTLVRSFLPGKKSTAILRKTLKALTPQSNPLIKKESGKKKRGPMSVDNFRRKKGSQGPDAFN